MVYLPTDVNRESAQDFAFQDAYVYSLSQRVTQQKLEPGTLELNSISSVLQRVERSYQFSSSTCQSPSEQYLRDLQTRDSRRIWPEKFRKSRCVQRWSSTHHLGENWSPQEKIRICSLSVLEWNLHFNGRASMWAHRCFWPRREKDWVRYQVLLLLILPKEESVKKYPHVLEEIQYGGGGKAPLEDALSPWWMTSSFETRN